MDRKYVIWESLKDQTTPTNQKSFYETLDEAGIWDKYINILKEENVSSVSDVKNLGKQGLIDLNGIGEKTAEDILEAVGE